MQVAEPVDLSDREAPVTGGGSGIGRHIAIGLAEAGARVFVASRKRASCREVAAEIQRRRGTAQAFEADLSAPAACERLMEQVLAATERLHVLVNNAARVAVGDGSEPVLTRERRPIGRCAAASRRRSRAARCRTPARPSARGPAQSEEAARAD